MLSVWFISSSGLLLTLKQVLRYEKPYKFLVFVAGKLITVFTNEVVIEYLVIKRRVTG